MTIELQYEETLALPGDAESIATALEEYARGETISTAELMRLLDEDTEASA